MTLVELIDTRPWLKITKSKENGVVREIWEDSKWQVVSDENWGKVPKIEAQCWLAVYNLL